MKHLTQFKGRNWKTIILVCCLKRTAKYNFIVVNSGFGFQVYFVGVRSGVSKTRHSRVMSEPAMLATYLISLTKSTAEMRALSESTGQKWYSVK